LVLILQSDFIGRLSSALVWVMFSVSYSCISHWKEITFS